jgi:hypothetical protein
MKTKILCALHGASVIKCCYAASLFSLTLSASNVTSMNTTTKRIILGSATNTYLKLSRLVTSPAFYEVARVKLFVGR